jgi:hypothetical protein
MLKYGLEYDHSFSHHDCQCYWLRTGDKWIPIDYSKHPDHWMKPLEAGVTTGLCEIPASWYADDLPPMMFIVCILSPSYVQILGMTFADHPLSCRCYRRKPLTATAGSTRATSKKCGWIASSSSTASTLNPTQEARKVREASSTP